MENPILFFFFLENVCFFCMSQIKRIAIVLKWKKMIRFNLKRVKFTESAPRGDYGYLFESKYELWIFSRLWIYFNISKKVTSFFYGSLRLTFCKKWDVNTEYRAMLTSLHQYVFQHIPAIAYIKRNDNLTCFSLLQQDGNC